MNKDNSNLWRNTIIAAFVFLLFYGTVQYLMSKRTEPVSLLVGTAAFWLVLFIIQKAMTKQTGKALK